MVTVILKFKHFMSMIQLHAHGSYLADSMYIEHMVAAVQPEHAAKSSGVHPEYW